MAMSTYDRFIAAGGLSEEDRKAWEAANGSKIGTTNAPMSFNEFIREGMLGSASRTDGGKGNVQTIQSADGHKMVDPTNAHNIQLNRNPGSWDSNYNTVQSAWSPTQYTPVAGQPNTSGNPAASPSGGTQVGSGVAGAQPGAGSGSPGGGLLNGQQGSNVPKVTTVQEQMNSLMSQDNPYMQMAKHAGMKYANSRGLLNSSIAGGASQSAAIQAALPIAQQDAETANRFAHTGYEYGLRQQAENAKFQNEMAVARLTQNSGLYAQFIQGMSEISTSNMDQASKDRAMSNLWTAINTGTEMATSLSTITFDANGNLVYSNKPKPYTPPVIETKPADDKKPVTEQPKPGDPDYWRTGGGQ